MDYALREIFEDYGDIVDPQRRVRGLRKFGRTANADTETQTTVANFQDAVINETFATSNSIDSIVSTSAADTEIMTVVGYTIDSDNNLTTVTQDATLNGQTAVTLGTALARADRAYVKDGTSASPAGNLAGDVAIYDGTLSGGGLTAGKPDVDAAVKLMVLGTNGRNQSQKCAVSIDKNDYWILTGAGAACSRANASTTSADCEIEVRHRNGVFRPLGLEMSLRMAASQMAEPEFTPYLIVPPSSDVRLVTTATANDVAVSGYIQGVLAIKN